MVGEKGRRALQWKKDVVSMMMTCVRGTHVGVGAQSVVGRVVLV